MAGIDPDVEAELVPIRDRLKALENGKGDLGSIITRLDALERKFPKDKVIFEPPDTIIQTFPDGSKVVYVKENK